MQAHLLKGSWKTPQDRQLSQLRSCVRPPHVLYTAGCPFLWGSVG